MPPDDESGAALSSEHRLWNAAQRLGHAFRDPSLLERALSHSSLPRDADPCESERLEFLGDAVVNLAISRLLCERHPQWSEGQLSLARASIVQTRSLAFKAQELGLDEAMRLGRGEEKTGGRRKHSILAAVYESAVGAVFVDAGYEAVQQVIRDHFASELEAEVHNIGDCKTRLQEQVQARHGVLPVYRLIDTSGPDHARHFVVAVDIGGRTVAEGSGSSKRVAEQAAAARALESLNNPEGE